MAGPNGGSRQPRDNNRRGSRMADKELAYSVRKGQQVTCISTTNQETVGYLCGDDDFHWKVIDANGVVTLVHKGTHPVVRVNQQPTYEDEPRKDELEVVVAPYRQSVMERFFNDKSLAAVSDEGERSA